MACWANSGMLMRIPRSIRPGLLFDESFLIYDQGDPRSVTAQEHRVIHHSAIDIQAPRGVPQGTSTGDKRFWSHNWKRLWGANAEDANKSEASPAYMKAIGRVATCVREYSSGRYYFQIHTKASRLRKSKSWRPCCTPRSQCAT